MDDDNILEWQIVIMGPVDTLYESAILKARLIFPPVSATVLLTVIAFYVLTLTLSSGISFTPTKDDLRFRDVASER